MPEPNRPPWRIETVLSGFSIGELITTRMTVILECESCRHKATWSSEDLARRLGAARETTLDRIGPKLRCGTCRSNWVRVFRGPADR